MKVQIQKLRRKMKPIICSQRGEMLVETIASFFIFTILLLAVSAMIQTSLKMTSIATQNAQDQQDDMNAVVLFDYSASGASDTITFTANGIVAEHAIVFHENGGLIAFAPK